MSPDDDEAIKARVKSVLADAQEIKRKAEQIRESKGKERRNAIDDVEALADRIDSTMREHLQALSEERRPVAPAEPRNSRPIRNGAAGERPPRGATPGPTTARNGRPPNWTIERILELADAHKEKNGTWPNGDSGRISESPSDTWTGVDLALVHGNRGLQGGSSLAKLLMERRGKLYNSSIPALHLELILAWADAFHARTNSWPDAESGAIAGAPGETWRAIDMALRRGSRRIGIKTSLARLLSAKRDAPYLRGQIRLTEEKILKWADAHHARTGTWPTRVAGDLPEAPRENWKRINEALIQGLRSLPKGSSLARFLAEHRGVRNRKAAPRLDVAQILAWSDSHYERHGRWPTCDGGKIEDAECESWHGVNSALKVRGRGLAGCGYSSLAELLDDRRGKLKHRGNRPGERVIGERADEA